MSRTIGKKPLQSLLVAPEWHKMVESGEKIFTVREGKRLYETGLVLLCCDKVSWCVSVEIKSVVHCALRDVSDDIAKNEGFKSKRELYAVLKGYYPNINWGSDVTVIGW